MTANSSLFLSPSDAARRLGVSVKALRLYEERGLVTPVRTAAGWRVYGPHEMARAAEIAALRALGLSLAQVDRVVTGDARGLEQALASHQATLEARLGDLARLVGKVRFVRADLAAGKTPTVGELAGLAGPQPASLVAFDLPWPWGGERFELRRVQSLNYIIGPLGSGKTRFALQLVKSLADARFIGLDRVPSENDDPRLQSRVGEALAWLCEEGATRSDALLALLAGLEAEGPRYLVVDMIEQGLDEGTQTAVTAYLRRRAPGSRPIFALTRSSAILDLAAMGPDEALILCPANHSPPVSVDPHPGAPGYEAVATCLAPPSVRARTEGTIAYRPKVA